ncbi:DDB1- and CUL4-associated factor 5 [Ditylenchus destructor]|uniref:DDB1- and CUL4-associated factor 5 n=1 Tax=Ditylenchus destructor TaxID=166010 RepID=A0AAD4NE14_9BILA|nr:DDB1- and CUL4-associated factor 5 [Ditylenchus destructor]
MLSKWTFAKDCNAPVQVPSEIACGVFVNKIRKPMDITNDGRYDLDNEHRGDDCNVLLWRTAKCCVEANPQPVTSMEAKHESNIFALRFSLFTERIYSAGNDFRLLVHDLKTRALLRTFTTHGGCYYRYPTK